MEMKKKSESMFRIFNTINQPPYGNKNFKVNWKKKNPKEIYAIHSTITENAGKL